MRKPTFLLAALLLTAPLFAQQVAGVVNDGQGKPISGSTVSLLRSKDSLVLKYAVTQDDGGFNFDNTKEGHYLVGVSYVGYAPAYSAAFQVSGKDIKLPPIALSKSKEELQGVTVTARKPLVEAKADKMVLNVEGTINATGSDALELLRKSPGVLVDRDDNLSLSGKSGVQVYIDGRPSPLSGKDLSEYLKSLQASQIEAIEIITNPSAKYEAAGNAGIINIRLKKNKAYGTNGSVTAGYNIGVYPKYNGGFSLNNRNKVVNLFGNYNFNRNHNYNFINIYRDVSNTTFNQRSNNEFKGLYHNYKAGVDYSLNKRTTLGLIANGTIGKSDFANISRTYINYGNAGTANQILVANNTNDMNRSNHNFNLNYRFVDTAGKELNLDADYGLYRNRSDQLQPNIYYDASGQQEQNRLVYNMLAPSNIDLYSFKGDYEQNFKKGKLGMGFKISYVNTDNDFERYNVYTTGKELDTLRSNRFDYKENINAAYVNYNRSFNGFILQAGLRLENTTSKGRSTGFRQVDGSYVSYDSSFTRPYTDLFPSAAITFNKNPMSQFSLTYSRRIDRPAYQDLNPFEFKLDENTFQKGNIDLRPQYTNSFGITHTYKSKLNTTLNYSHVKDMFAQLLDTIEKTKSFITRENLATQDIVSLNISYPFQHKGFSSFINLNSYYSHYKADFGAKGRQIDLDVFAYNLYMQNSLKFAKTWTVELSGWYTSPSIWQGTFETRAMGGIDGGMQKQVLKGKATVKATVTDLFLTMRWSSESNFAGQYVKASGGWESRQLRLNFTYRFGSNEVKDARQRKTGLEDENKRANSGSGGIGQ